MIEEPISKRAVTSGMTPYTRRFLALVLLGFSCVALDSVAQQPRASQFDVEAVYVFKFSQFVNWPGTGRTQGSFDICILGDDPFGPFLDKTIRGESLNGKAVAERRIMHAQEAQSCAILYISRSEANRLRQVLDTVHDWPVLTVSDLPDFADKGGMIQFILQGGKVRFEVNLIPATRAGLTLSSELLKVAVEVKGTGTQGAH
jgi:YfiR/HmsC-like